MPDFIEIRTSAVLFNEGAFFASPEPAAQPDPFLLKPQRSGPSVYPAGPCGRTSA